MAATLGLVPRLVFGFRSNVRDSLQYAEDGSYVYPAGHNIVITDGKSHRFVSGTPECEGITAIMLSPNKKLLAVAERAEKAVVSVYDMQTLKRRKQLLAADVGSKEYLSLSFSPDGKLLLAQGGGPDWNLLLWAWEKSKLASSIRSTNLQGSPVVQATLSPGEGSLVTVIGTGVLRMFKVADQLLKPMPLNANRRDTLSFTCQTWTPLADRVGDAGAGPAAATDAGKGGTAAAASTDRERQLMGTVDGKVLLFEGAEPRATFSVDEGRAVESLAAYSKGFVAGLDGGLVALFDRDERDYYRHTRTFTVMDHPQPVRSLAISANEEQLVLSLAGGPAFSLALNNQELMKTDEMNFELLGPGVHTAGVTGLDMCVRRPLIATCSTDRTVRLWNYAERTCDLSKSFAEEAYSVAIHPTGLLVLVGFADKLRLLSVLMDDLKTVKEVAIKGCRDVCFSNGGQFFAAANGITLSLYNTYTCECLGNLRGHNGKVRAMCWSAADTSIVSAGADGAVYEWRLSDSKREKENVLKGCQYNAVAATPDMKTLIAAGSDKKIKELEDNLGAGTQVSRELETQVLITALALPYGGKILFAATEMGVVRCYKYPLTGEFYEVKCHEGPVSRLRVSYDDCLLVSAGEDGSVVLLDIRDKELAKTSSRQQQETLPWSEEVLVSKAELEERRSHVLELEQQVAELTMQTEYQLRLKDLHVQERVKELSDKFSSELEADRQKFELLLQEKNEQELEYEEKLKQAEGRHGSQLAALDAQYQTKMMAEVERYQQLLQEKEALNERWDEQNALLVESHERVIAELAEESEAKLAEEVLAAEALRQEKQALEKEAAETKRQLEEDADREIEELKEKYEQRLATEREACLRLKGENGIMRKKFQALQKDIEEQREQLNLQHEQQKELYTTIKGLEKDIGGLKREIRERDETIGDKERRIYELKKKNQELEKFKFVLDYKIKELKKQIEPREVEVNEMRETIRAMDSELERYHKSNAGLDLAIQNLRLKEQGLQSEVIVQRGERADTEVTVRKMQFEIAELAHFIQDPKALKEQVKALYHRHCGADGAAAAGSSRAAVTTGAAVGDVGGEYARQRNYLEKTIESLKKKLAADSEAHRADELRIMGQNVTLIRELNELRREIRALKSSAAGRSGLAAGSSTTSVTSSLRTSGPARLQQSALSPAAGRKAAAAAGGKAAGSSGGGHPDAVAVALSAAQAVAVQQQQQQQQQQQEEVQALGRELEMQRDLIGKLRAELEARDAHIGALEAAAVARPLSRELLPPLGAAAACNAAVAGVADAVTAGAVLAADGPVGSSSMRSRGSASSSSTARPGSAGPGSSRRVSGASSIPASAGSGSRVLSRPGSSRMASQSGRPASAAAVSDRERPVSSGSSGGTAIVAAAAAAAGATAGSGDLDPTPWESEAAEAAADDAAATGWATDGSDVVAEAQPAGQAEVAAC